MFLHGSLFLYAPLRLCSACLSVGTRRSLPPALSYPSALRGGERPSAGLSALQDGGGLGVAATVCDSQGEQSQGLECLGDGGGYLNTPDATLIWSHDLTRGGTHGWMT